MSDSNTDFHETLSRLSASSRGKETERISDWIINWPSVTDANALPPVTTTTTSASNNAVTITASLQFVENGTACQAGIASQDPAAVYVTVTDVPPPLPNITLNQQPAASVSPQSNPMNVIPSVPMTVQPPVPTLNPMITTTATITTSPAVPPTIPAPSNPIVNVPVSHVFPNLTAWTFPHVPVIPSVQLNRPLSQSQLTPIAATTASLGSTPLPTTVPFLPVTCGGTVYYLPPPVVATPAVASTSTQPSSLFPSANAQPFVPSATTSVTQTSVPSFTIQDVAQILASTKKDHLPEWKLSQYSGNPIQWHERYGQFKSAIDSAPLTDDVKLTYLKTLVTGKAKVAIAEFAYCGAMYKDARKTLERKFGQPQAVVTAYLDKLANVPPVKMHNSESIISYSATVSSLVGVFRSLNYNQDLSSASLLDQAVQKLPPNMKEAWSMYTVKRSLDRPTLIDFNEWLKDKAEAHERMKTASGKPKSDENPQPSVNKTKTTSKVFAATTSNNQQNSTSKPKPDILPNCVAYKEKHPLWRCPVFRKKTPTERAKLVADNKFCFCCFNANHSFRQGPQPRKCTKEGCESTHNTFLHGADLIFPNKNQVTKPPNPESSTCVGATKINEQLETSSGLPSVTDVKGLLQITEVELHSTATSEKVLALCDSACRHSWISARLANRLKVQGVPTKLTVHGITT